MRSRTLIELLKSPGSGNPGVSWIDPLQRARLEKVVCSDRLCRPTGKGTLVTAEFVGMHMVKPLRAWFGCPTAVGGEAGGREVGAWSGEGRQECGGGWQIKGDLDWGWGFH